MGEDMANWHVPVAGQALGAKPVIPVDTVLSRPGISGLMRGARK